MRVFISRDRTGDACCACAMAATFRSKATLVSRCSQLQGKSALSDGDWVHLEVSRAEAGMSCAAGRDVICSNQIACLQSSMAVGTVGPTNELGPTNKLEQRLESQQRKARAVRANTLLCVDGVQVLR